MTHPLDRRDFLQGALAATAGLGLARLAPAEDAKKPLFLISLAEWSLHRALKAGKMTNFDFPRVAKKDYGIDAVEYVNQFFKRKPTDKATTTDAKYLAELKKVCGDEGVKSLLIMCDGEGALGDADAKKRDRAVQNHHRWADAAKELGCHSIRVNAQSSGSYDDQMKFAADGLRKLTEYTAKLGLNCIVENHGGLSSNGAWLAATIKKVGHKNCGTLPDFGNFRVGKNKDGKEEWYDRYKGVREMMPYAKAVSAKSHDFDAKGNETRTDYKKMLGIVLDAGYRGYLGIEYEGGKISEPEGVKATKKLLEKVRDELAPAYAKKEGGA